MARLSFLALFVLHVPALILAQSVHGQQSGTVEVVNLTSRDLLIWINGEPHSTVAARSEDSFSGMAGGTLTLLATDPGAEVLLASETTSLGAGGTFEWTLYPVAGHGGLQPTGTVVLVNRSDRAVEVFLGENQIARLAPSSTRTIARVVAGEVTARAEDLDGKIVAQEELTIGAGEVTRWIFGQ